MVSLIEAVGSALEQMGQTSWEHFGIVSAWALLGALIFIPAALVARKQSRVLHLVMIGMVYPAVLGSILFNVLPMLTSMKMSGATLPLVLTLFMIILHFVYDYVFIVNFYARKKAYSADAFFVDMFVALFMYLSATAIDLTNGTADLTKVATLFFSLYALFVVWDVLQRETFLMFMGDLMLAASFFVYLVAYEAIGSDFVGLAPMVLSGLIFGAAIWAAFGVGDDLTAHDA